MTIQEIHALRRAGRLHEALQAAETEFAVAKNRYTVGALFWCLNDFYKQQERDDALVTIERMKAIAEEYGAGDEMMINSLNRALQFALPYSSDIKEAIEKAKNGEDVSASYSAILQAYNSSELGESLHRDFGWLIYYILKNTPLNDANARKQLLNLYLKLGLEKPSLLHSLILGEAIKVEQNTPLQFRIRDFVRLWGLENLTVQDWEQFKTDAGHLLPSNVEKLIGVYAKEVKTDGIVAPDEFVALVDNALDRYPQSQNMPYFKAIILISQGRQSEAVKYYKDLILRFPSKHYLWSQLAELAEEDDVRVGLLCKALSCGVEDSFLGGVRLRLANMLISKGQLSNAKFELDKYQATYDQQGWRPKPEYYRLLELIRQTQAAESNNDLYAECALAADDFIYSALPSIVAIKISDRTLDDRNLPSKKFVQWTLRSKDGELRLKKPMKFGLGRCKNGSVFDVKIYDGKIVCIKPSRQNPLDQEWIKKVEGTVSLRTDRNGNPYTIIDGVYVGRQLLNNVATGQNVMAIAIQQQDGRWSAIALTNL